MHILERISALFRGDNWLIIPAALLAIVFHEVSHGYVAYLLGDSTAHDNNRLSLNPLKHIDILGVVCMIFFGFGWAKPVPISPYYFKNKRLGVFLVSLAGPLSNIVMAFLGLLLARGILFFVPSENSLFVSAYLVIVEFFLIFAILNVGLAVFNLLPIPPLDGSKILFSFLPAGAYRFILNYERYGMLILIILINIPYFNSFLTSARGWLFDALSGLATLIIT